MLTPAVNYWKCRMQIAWWIDSGATTHVCKDRCWFKTYEPVEDGYVLYMGDDHFVPVHGKGSVEHVHYKRTSIAGNVYSCLHTAIDENPVAVVRLPDPKRKTLGEKVSITRKSIESRDAIFDENRFSSIPRPKDIIPNSNESQMDDHSDGVPSEILEPHKEVIDDEIGSIMENNTWVLSDLPPGCKPLGCKWIFKRKMKVDGTIDKFKARLVIQGFRQKEGIDYFDTYAPVARITTIRLLLALAAIHNLGFVMPGNEHKVCKLVKSLYGLKQAPKQWHQKFDEVVLSSGFLLNQSDKCVYSKFDSSGKGVIICLYVDDMLIFGTDQNQVDKTKKFLSSKGLNVDMREAAVLLGIKIKRENKGIVITQSHYIEKILKKFNREDCSPVSTPMDPVEKLKPHTGKPVDQLEYSRAIGCLMYAMTSTRPDIAYVVGRLSRFTSNPSRQHWKAITRVFKYLRGTMNYGLSYMGYPSVLEGYSDASWNQLMLKMHLLRGSGGGVACMGGVVSVLGASQDKQHCQYWFYYGGEILCFVALRA
ncbi:zinc finger, CCHC-type containing protein [Tanacetum coccineum]